MFSVYQKIITPESSPVLGPVKTSNDPTTDHFTLCTCCCSDRHGKKSDMNDPNTNTNTNNTNTNTNTNNTNTNTNNTNTNTNTNTNNTNTNTNTNTNNTNTNTNKLSQEKHKNHVDDTLDPKTHEPKYPFWHATHYTYSITSPRIICEFETGTPL